MIIEKSKIPFVPLLVFSFIVLFLYLTIYLMDFQFVKNIAHIENTNNLSEKNIPQYINLYVKSICFICLTGIIFFFSSLIISERLLHRIFRKYFLFLAMFFFSSYIITFQILKFKSFHCYIDLAVPLQVLHNVIIGNGPISSLEEALNGNAYWFSAHFSPIIYPISIIFSLVPKVETIIVLQTLGFTLTCLPLYWYSNRVLKNEIASVLFASAFLLYPPIHYMALYEFEYLKFAIPLLTFTFYFLYRGKYILYFIFLLLSLCCREDVSVVTFALGIYIIFVRKEFKIGVLTSAISIVYFVTLIFYIMPTLRGGHGVFQLTQYTHLGKNFSEIFHTLLFNPLFVLKILLSPLRVINFILYTLPVFFFSFFSPSVFFIALPNLLTSFLNGSTAHYTIFLYHLSPAVPFIFLSSVNGIDNVALFLDKKYSINSKESLPPSFISPIKKNIVVSCAFILLIIGILSQYFFGPSPLSRQFWDKNYTLADFYTHNYHYSNYQVNKHHTVANEIIKLIPSDATISAQQPLLPHLYDRKKLYIFPDIKDDTEYVLIDKKHRVKTGIGDFQMRPQFYYGLIEENSQEWELIKEEYGIFLFKKRQWN